MRKLKLLLVLFMIVNLNIGCLPKKVLPKETQEGLNTFGVKIDGKVWLPVHELSLTGGPRTLYASLYNHTLEIKARKRSSDEEILLIVENVESVGSYRLKEDNSGGISASKYSGDLVDDEYYLFSGGINELNITKLDTTNKIVSGTFKAQFKGKTNNVIKNFSNGTFDLKL